MSAGEEPTPAPRPLATAMMDVLDRQSGRVLAAGCLLAVIVVGMADHLTNVRLSFSIFYLLPVFVAGSRSRAFGLRMSVASASTWLVADLSGGDALTPPMFLALWNVALRFLVFALVVALIDALRCSLLHERRLSRCDELTGLANYRAFYEIAERERRRLAPSGRPLTLAYIDIDDFKSLNDRYGHAAGDEVIVATARLLTANLREADTIARIGGDEFALLLPETDEGEAVRLLERVHGRLVEAAGDRGWAIGYSGGAVTFEAPGQSVDAMVAEADRVMYQVKRSGKNAMRFVAA